MESKNTLGQLLVKLIFAVALTVGVALLVALYVMTLANRILPAIGSSITLTYAPTVAIVLILDMLSSFLHPSSGKSSDERLAYSNMISTQLSVVLGTSIIFGIAMLFTIGL